ncbi:hypothetical protein TWF173_005518 [Orbilia oligospora]|nr:hypothetical protein TWF173_005518 [Orbilia oligospora]
MDESVISLLGAKYPQDWTAEEVVDYLSKPRRPLPVQKFFQSDAGRALFIDNYITGAVLFDDSFTRDTLKDDLGIKQVGLCILLWSIIQEIRRNYPQRPDIDLGDDSLLPPPPQNTSRLSLRDYRVDGDENNDDDDGGDDDSYPARLVPETKVLKFGNIQRYADEVLLEAQVEWSGPLVATPSKLVTREAHSIFRSNDGDDNNGGVGQLIYPAGPSTPRIHFSGDDDDIDARSTKRPRLDNDGDEHEVTMQRILVQMPPVLENDVDDHTSLDSAAKDHSDATTSREYQPDYHIVTDDPPGMEDIPPIEEESSIPLLRLRGHESGEQLTFTESESDASPLLKIRRQRAPRLRQANRSRSSTYLDRSPVTAGEMALVGDDSNDTDCFVVRRKVSAGTRMGAARITNAFFHKKLIDKRRINGKFHIAYRHHTLRHLHRYKRDSITIVNDQEVQVGENLKNHIADFPDLDVRNQIYKRKSDRVQLMDATAGLDRKRMDPWEPVEDADYYQALGVKHDLLAKLQGGDQFVPVDYRGPSPGLDLETEREIRRDLVSHEQKITRKSTGKKLTIEEMEGIWEQVKSKVVEKWRESAFPRFEMVKYKCWMEAQKKNSRRQIVIGSMVTISQLDTRLSNHWDGYLKNNWYSAVELRKFMEAQSKTTIQSRELAIWRRDTFQGKKPETPDSSLSTEVAPRRKIERGEAKDAEGEPTAVDEEDLSISDGEETDFEDSESDMDQFIVDDTVYDEGHENMRAENDAVLARLQNRYLYDELAADVVLEDDDEQEDQPKPKGRKNQQATGSSSNHGNDDTNLPDAGPEGQGQDGDESLYEQSKKSAKASSDSFRWFSNELPETARKPETSVPKVGLAVSDDESPATPILEEPISTNNGSGTPTPEPSIETESAAKSVPEPTSESTAKPIAAISNSDPEFGDTGPFTIEQGTPVPKVATPPPVIKAENPILTVFKRGEFIDLTNDTPVLTPEKTPVPGPSNSSIRGRQNSPIELDEDTQLQIAIIESRETALKEGVRLSPSPSPVDRTPSAPQGLTATSSAPSSSAAKIQPKVTKRPVICTPLEGITSAWKRDLQARYDKGAGELLSLRKLISTERSLYGNELMLDKVLGCWNISQSKPVDTQSLGIKEQDKPAYSVLARLYSAYSFPRPKSIDYKRQKLLLSNMDNFLLFTRELTPILGDVAEYEERKADTEGTSTGIVSEISQATGQNTQRPVNLESDKSKGKGKAKLDALSLLLESDSEEEITLSQRSFQYEATSEAEASRSGTSTPRRQKINRTKMVDHETQRIRQLNDKERLKLMERERRGRKAGQTSDLINLGHLAKDDPIYFPASDQPLYDFQKSGVQFLWRNIVVSEKRTGALLAHTMGMGKTRQVITVLCAIADAAVSERPRTQSQIPAELRNMRALIVCPPGLIQNWSEEISKWADGALATVYPVTQAHCMNDRIEAIEAWAAEGTVLIIGYESFSQLCSRTESIEKEYEKLKNEASIPDSVSKDARFEELEAKLEQVTKIKNLLLDTPTIVVADEAHKIKTKTSKIAKLFGMFKTRSRIAMTGSPLANDLTEYFHIMKWVDPEYAGDEAEFNNNFKLPIRDGLYINSLDEEIKESNKKQRELIALWGPKMSRVNIKQIKGLENTLPPKTEFLITLPLTELQYKLYSFYAKEAKRDTEEGYYCGFFDFVAQLGVLLNHPALFWKAFEKRQAKKKAKIEGPLQSAKITEVNLSDEEAARESSEEGEAEEDPDSQKAILGADSAISHRLQEVITATENLKDTAHSYRIQVLLRILESCITIKEKVLVFSQSVETLKYIGEVLDKQSIKFVKITGEVSTAKRQTIARGFNNEDSNKFVFLISTKAGGLGLNIQSASRIVVFDSQFSPQDEEQAVGRAYRLGQTKHVFVYRFRIGGTLEDVIHNNSLLKMSLAARLVDKTTPARKAKKSEAADWFRAPRYIPRDPAGFEGMQGKDPKVMDKFLEEDWLRELVTQDMYEVHYEEPVAEEQVGESSETASGGAKDGASTEPGVDEMDIDNDTTANATLGAPKKKVVTSTIPATGFSVAATNSPATPPLLTPTSKATSEPKRVNRTHREKQEFRAKMQQLRGEKATTPSSSCAGVTPSQTNSASGAQSPRPQAGPSAPSKGNVTQSKEHTEQPKRRVSLNKDEWKGIQKPQTKGPAPVPPPVPPPLVLPSQSNSQTLPSQASPRVLPSQASPRIIPSQRDAAAGPQSPVTPTGPLADRIQRQPGERSPRPYGSSHSFSQMHGGQPTRLQRTAGSRKPYDRPGTDRRASAPQSRGQENYIRHASSPRRPRSPPRGTPRRRPDSERSRPQQPPPRPSSPRERR